MEKHNNQRKHSLYEIFRIMTTMLSRDGPIELNLKDVVKYCYTLNNEYHETFTTVIDSEGAVVDLPIFLETLSNTLACPIIYYKGQRRDNDTVEIMRKLFKFLQANGLNNKHLITFNFPADCRELFKCKAAGFSPNNVIKVLPKVTPILAKESSKSLGDVESLFGNNTTRFTLTGDVKENCYRLKDAIDQCANTRDLDFGFHLQRIIFLGQIGSGRKTQARLLAKRWHLVFRNLFSSISSIRVITSYVVQAVDFRVLLLEYAKLNDCFHDLFMKMRNVHQFNRKLMASILFKRITKRDCMENGWILVGYVSSVADLKIMETQFYIVPNKIVFIHCRGRLCLDRLRTRIIQNSSKVRHPNFDEDMKYAKLGFVDLFSPSCAINYIVTEMDHFCRNRREILKYCQDEAKYIAHIDGERSVATVTTLLSGQVEKFNF